MSNWSGRNGPLSEKSEDHIDLLMPGYTHLQPAQAVRFSHWLLSYFWMLNRDRDRLDDLTSRVNVLPLGSGALSGNPFGVDQQFLAEELGFDAVTFNSMDAVSDRDYLVEFLAWASLTQVHLSRLAEDLCCIAAGNMVLLRSRMPIRRVEFDATEEKCQFYGIAARQSRAGDRRFGEFVGGSQGVAFHIQL